MDYNNRSYYDILGVEKTSSFENIERARDRLKFGNPTDRVPFSMWGEIDEAYKILSNPEKRIEYDKTLDNKSINFLEQEVKSIKEKDVSENPKLKKLSNNYETPYLEKTNAVSEKEENNDTISEAKNNEETFKQPMEEKTGTSEIPDDKSPAGDFYNIYSDSKMLQNEKEKKDISKFITLYVPIESFKLTSKYKKKLIKEKETKKISKISTREIQDFEEYLQNLDNEFNKILSEPHNNYKLSLLKVKYERQIELLTKILEIRATSKYNDSLLKYKLNLVSIKLQINEVENSLKKVEKQIERNNEQQGLTILNNELIDINKQIASQDVSSHTKIRKLEIKQRRILKERDKSAEKEKFKIITQNDIYDKFIKAKSFVRALGYMVKPEEEVDDFLNDKVRV